MVFSSIILVLLVSNVNGYIIGPQVMDWSDAEAYCISQGSHLATISNDADRDSAKALCIANDDNSGRGCWIGLYEDSNDVWNWADGSSLGYGFNGANPAHSQDPWYPNEPNNVNEDCIHLYRPQNYNWNDAYCNDNNFPLCNDVIQNFGFKTSNNQWAGSSADISLTLQYDSNVYECTINGPSSTNTEYSCNAATSMVGSNCGSDEQLFIENTDYIPEIDAVIIDYVFITYSSGNKQTINLNDASRSGDDLCLDEDDCGSNTVLIDINTETATKGANPSSYSCTNSGAGIGGFGIATTGGQYAATTADVRLTLLYDANVYECTVNPSALNTEYSCNAANSMTGSGCGNGKELFIENMDYIPEIDLVDVKYILITDTDGNVKQKLYLNGLCLDQDDCASNTALVDIEAGTSDKSVDNYFYDCDSMEITTFGFATSSNQHAGSGADIELTLYYGTNVYECTISAPSASDTEYSCNAASSMVGSDCADDNKQLFIDNTDDDSSQIDAVIIDYIFITDQNGNKRTVNVNDENRGGNDLCLDTYDCTSSQVLIDIESGTSDKTVTTAPSYVCPNLCNSFDITLRDSYEGQMNDKRGGPMSGGIDVTCFRYNLNDAFYYDSGKEVEAFLFEDGNAIRQCGLNLRSIVYKINGLGNANTGWKVRPRGKKRLRGIFIRWSSNQSFKMCLAGTGYSTIPTGTIKFTRSDSKPLANLVTCSYDNVVPDYCSGIRDMEYILGDDEWDDDYMDDEWIDAPYLVLKSELEEEDDETIFAKDVMINNDSLLGNMDNTMLSIICVISVLMIGVVMYSYNRWNKQKEYEAAVEAFEQEV